MFGMIEGQRLNLAKMHIANYCAALAAQAGGVDVLFVVTSINAEFKLVPEEQVAAFGQDVLHFYNCLQNQQVGAINRGGYWKWRALSPFEAKVELNQALGGLPA